jgi:hypothetical protein
MNCKSPASRIRPAGKVGLSDDHALLLIRPSIDLSGLRSSFLERSFSERESKIVESRETKRDTFQIFAGENASGVIDFTEYCQNGIGSPAPLFRCSMVTVASSAGSPCHDEANSASGTIKNRPRPGFYKYSLNVHLE